MVAGSAVGALRTALYITRLCVTSAKPQKTPRIAPVVASSGERSRSDAQRPIASTIAAMCMTIEFTVGANSNRPCVRRNGIAIVGWAASVWESPAPDQETKIPKKVMGRSATGIEAIAMAGGGV